MKLAGGSCALQVHSSGQKWLVGTVLAFSLTIFWSNVVLMPLSYSSVRLMLFGSFHVILIVVSPGMIYKTGQMSVDASVRAVLTFLKSWDSETTGPAFMRLGIYILWVLQKTFRKWSFDFRALCRMKLPEVTLVDFCDSISCCGHQLANSTIWCILAKNLMLGYSQRHIAETSANGRDDNGPNGLSYVTLLCCFRQFCLWLVTRIVSWLLNPCRKSGGFTQWWCWYVGSSVHLCVTWKATAA